MAPRRHYQRKTKYRVRRKRSLLKRKSVWLLILFLVFAGTSSYLIFFSSIFQVKAIEVSGNKNLSKEEIQQAIGESVSKNFLFFNFKNIFLANTQEIKQELSKKYNYLSEVTLKKEFPNKIVAFIKERLAVALWCSNSDCYLLDKNGVIFDKSKPDGFFTISSEKNSDNELGKTVINPDLLNFILEAKEAAKNLADVDISGFLISADEDKITANTSSGWKIFLSASQDIQEQIINLEILMKQKIPQQKLKQLDYIELRFGNRVYFKYK